MKTGYFLWFYVVFISAVVSLPIFGQLPETEVWMADFKNVFRKPSLLSLSYLSGFHRATYNNQPSFHDYNEIYISSAKSLSDKTDLCALNIKDKTWRKVTQTPLISEFSPTPLVPKQALSCVRIEEDGSDQSLWLYPLDRSHMGRRLLTQYSNVGYHTWVNENEVAVYLVSEPHILKKIHIQTGEESIVGEKIGRCTKTDTDGFIYFVQKNSETVWSLTKFDPDQKIWTTIIKMPYQSEDFDITPQGIFITAKGSRLYSYDPKKNENWQILYDFQAYGLRHIERPVILRDRVIFVENKSK